jgi:hypothetical protein
MSNPTYTLSDICPAFESSAVGSRVVDAPRFFESLNRAVANIDSVPTKVPGQWVVTLDDPSVCSGGTGPASSNPDHYVLREHRGKVGAYLRREFATPPDNVRVVIYSREGYLRDPEVTSTDATFPPCDYVIVAVLASSGPPSPRSPYRFVHCLAGGNLEADHWTVEEIRSMARDIIAFTDGTSVVAD